MRGDGYQWFGQTPRHVFDKPGFAAPGRSLQHDRQALGEGGLKHRYLVAHGLIEGFRNNSVSIEVHAHLHEWCVGKAARQRDDLLLPSAVGSASVALWARHILGARKQAFMERLEND